MAAKKPNILIVRGDDIGMWNISAYHRGMMPSLARLKTETYHLSAAPAARDS